MKRLSYKLMILVILIFVFILFPNKVDAMTIVLDPGHGGNDSGSSSENLIEKDITLKISNYLKEYLSEYENVSVLLTHNGSTMSIQDRADFARNNNADLLVSIHINSSNASFKKGAEVYVTSRTDLPKYNKEMTELGNRILANISMIGIDNNGVSTRIAENSNGDPEYKYFDNSNGDYYGIIRRAMKGGHATDLGDDFSDGSGIPTVLVEHAYLSNSSDKQFINSDEKLKKIAKADCDAIVSYYGLSKNENIDITEYLFDSTCYADVNKDLKAAYGYDKNLLYNHYKIFGINEGRQASPIFNPKYYLNKYSDLKSAFGNNYYLAYNHFIVFGIKEGRAGSKFFDSKYYLNTYNDLKKSFNNNYTKAVKHFMLFGINEGRAGSGEFNVKNYYDNCSTYIRNNLGKNYIKYYEHSEGANVIIDNAIDISEYLFDANTYYNLYSDLQVAIGYNPELLKIHYYTFGIKEGRKASCVFDPKFYLNTYTDLKNAFGENYEAAYNHFISFGINEGRAGSSEFNPKNYLNNYQDLSNVFGTNYSKALRHFIIFGRNEQRKRNLIL